MIGWLTGRREARRAFDRVAVLLAVSKLQPKHCHGLDIMRLSGLSSGRAHVALAWLEGQGDITSSWGDGEPRRRLYRMADRVEAQ